MIKKKMKIGLMGALASSFASLGSMANAAATAAGDKYDGIVEVQDTVQGIIDSGGAFTIIIVSVIIGAATFMARREWSSLVTPVVVGLFLSVGLTFATGIGGFTADTSLYASDLDVPSAVVTN